MKNEASLLPEAVQLSVWDAIRLNAWAAVAVVVAAASRIWLKSDDLTGAGRVVVALMPLIPALLYAASLWRWARDLDEFQRRLQLESLCLTLIGVLFVSLGLDLLRIGGLAAQVSLGWEGYFALTFFGWATALTSRNRGFR